MIGAIALVVLPTVQWASAEVLSEWRFRNPVPTSADLYNGAFGNGVYVLVGRGSGVHRSSDLQSWVSSYPGPEVQNVVFADGVFTISGGGGQILRSTNAEVWDRYATGLSTFLYGLSHDGERYVAVGEEGGTATSVDGMDWTTGSIGDGNLYWSVAAGGGRFVAVSGQGTIATTVDGTTCQSILVSPGQVFVALWFAWIAGVLFGP